MTAILKPWWRNCALKADPKITELDHLEDQLSPIGSNISKVRELISTLELCHHKSEQWVNNIIEAIGAEKTDKGLGSRPPDQQHPVEKVWANACAVLSAWCAGTPMDFSQLLNGLGKRSHLKEWQVQRIIDKIRTHIHWPKSIEDPSAQYAWLLLSAGEYEVQYLDKCPEPYAEHEAFWLETVRTIIKDPAELSLGLAIDMLWPCHFSFKDNLKIVLDAIGGNLNPERPFAACGRNLHLSPNSSRFELISNTLRVFCGNTDLKADGKLLSKLGEPTETRKWLAASLSKTIRLQLNPQPELQAMCSLIGPEWIKE